MTSYRQRGKAPQALLRAASSPPCGGLFSDGGAVRRKPPRAAGRWPSLRGRRGFADWPCRKAYLKKFHHPEHCTINRTPKHPKNRLVRHCGQNAHNEFKNLCNFLNKTPLRNGVFFGTIKLCKSVYLELCPEQNWGACQAARDLCGPDNRTAL